MQKSYREIVTFLNVANPWLQAHPEESKLRYAVKKMVKSCTTLWTGYTEQLEDLDIEHCAVDKDGVILKDERNGFQFTKDGIKKRNEARRKLFASEVEVTPYFATEIPEKVLTFEERDAFVGFVLPEDDQ